MVLKFTVSLALFFSLLVLFFRNAIGSLMSFIFAVIFSSISLFNLEIEFLTYIYLLIYVGAVAILLLFSILILNLSVNISFKISFLVEEVFWSLLIYIKFSFIYFFVILEFIHILYKENFYWNKLYGTKSNECTTIAYNKLTSSNLLYNTDGILSNVDITIDNWYSSFFIQSNLINLLYTKLIFTGGDHYIFTVLFTHYVDFLFIIFLILMISLVGVLNLCPFYVIEKK